MAGGSEKSTYSSWGSRGAYHFVMLSRLRSKAAKTGSSTVLKPDAVTIACSTLVDAIEGVFVEIDVVTAREFIFVS